MTAPLLPNSQAAFVDENGRPTREAYTYYRKLQQHITDQIDSLAALQQQVDGISAPYIVGIDSLAGDTITRQMALVNDSAAPGNNVFYGTNGSGTRGYIAVSDAALSTSDVTTNNATTAKHGFAPKYPNDATKYLDGTGAYTVPAGGGMVKIAKVVTTSSQATIAFNSIAGTYTDLLLVISGRDTNAGVASAGLMIGFNSDTTAGNYTSSNYVEGSASAATSGTHAAATTGCYIGYIPGTLNSAQAVGVVRIEIPNYAGAVFHKIMQSQTYEDLANGSSLATDILGAKWKSTAAITSILLTAGGTAFVDGTTATLYGLG